MYYVVGLGNPGDEYCASRHNVGWMVLDAFCSTHKLSTPHTEKKFSGQITAGVVEGQSVTILYPSTFMNHSGSAVAKLVSPADTPRLIVVYDDIDLPFGVVRVAFGRGSGGHNGLESIISSLKTKQFIRVRVGIGKVGFWPWEGTKAVRRPQGDALAKYVLAPFTKREQTTLTTVCTTATTAITDCITRGLSQAMNIHNQEGV